jgi:hypothetical protein
MRGEAEVREQRSGWRRRTRAAAGVAMVGLGLLAAACGPDGRQVRSEFARRNPAARVLDVFPGQGDTGRVFVNVLYRMPGDTAVLERKLLYRRTRQGWRLDEGRVSHLPGPPRPTQSQ